MLLADLGGRGNGVGGRGTIGGTGPRVGIGIEAVALEFSGHRRVVDPELGGNGPRRQWRVRLHTGLDRHPILERQVAIGTSARRGGRSRADRGRHASQLAKLDRDSQAASPPSGRLMSDSRAFDAWFHGEAVAGWTDEGRGEAVARGWTPRR